MGTDGLLYTGFNSWLNHILEIKCKPIVAFSLVRMKLYMQ